MYKYFCVENKELVGVLDYEPQVPPSVLVARIRMDTAKLIDEGSHYFNTATMKVVPYIEGQMTDTMFGTSTQTKLPEPTAMCVPLNSTTTPEWAKGELVFSYTQRSGESGVLSVINNTGFAVTASASTSVGAFTEVGIETEGEYSYECKSSDNPVGFLMFRTTGRKR